MNDVRICRNCSIQLNTINAVKDAGKRDGIASICKTCNGLRTAEWKKNNPQKVKLQRKRQYQKMKQNPEKLKQQSQAYRQWYRKIRGTGVNGTLQITIGSVKFRAKQLNIPFDLDIDYLASIVTENCPVDGLPMDWAMNLVRNGKPTDRSPSIDRIIPALGYIKGNVKFIAHKWNTWKSDMLLRDLELIIAYTEKYAPKL
jgi:hypothetical protein